MWRFRYIALVLLASFWTAGNSFAVYRKPRNSISKPPLGTVVNTSNPLSQGLVGIWALNEGAGAKLYSSIDLSTGTFNGVSIVNWAVGRMGKALQFTSALSSGSVVVSNADKFTLSPTNPTITMECWFEYNAQSNAAQHSLFVKAYGTNQSSPDMGLTIFDGGSANLRIWTAVQGQIQNTAGQTFVNQALNDYVVVFSSSGANVSASTYVNGKFTTTITGASNGLAMSGGALSIGGQQRTGSIAQQSPDALIYRCAYWNRGLSATEIKQLYLTPWVMFDSPNIKMPTQPLATNGISSLWKRTLPYTNRKPPLGTKINASSTLSQGMVFATILNENGGVAHDIVSGKASSSATGTWSNGPYGPALSFNGSSDEANFGDRAEWRKGGDVTISVYANPVSESNTRGAFAKRQTISPFAQLDMLFNCDESGSTASGKWAFLNRDGTFFSQAATTSGLDGKYHLYTVTFQYSINTVNFYLDGILQNAVGSSSGVGNYTGTDPICVGSGNSSLFYNKTISHAMYWSRALSATEIKQLYLTPFSMFSRSEYLRIYPSTATPSAIVSPALSIQGSLFKIRNALFKVVN